MGERDWYFLCQETLHGIFRHAPGAARCPTPWGTLAACRSQVGAEPRSREALPASMAAQLAISLEPGLPRSRRAWGRQVGGRAGKLTGNKVSFCQMPGVRNQGPQLSLGPGSCPAAEHPDCFSVTQVVWASPDLLLRPGAVISPVPAFFPALRLLCSSPLQPCSVPDSASDSSSDH